MRYSLFILMLFTSLGLMNAQDTIQSSIEDSSMIMQIEDNRSSIDTIEVMNFSLSTSGNSISITAHLSNEQINPPTFFSKFKINDATNFLKFENGRHEMNIAPDHKGKLFTIRSYYTVCPENGTDHCLEAYHTQLLHLKMKQDGQLRIQQIPLFWSILPPLMAILLALLFKQVLLALFIGILSGSWLVAGMPMSPYAILQSLLNVIDHYIIGALNDGSHLSVLVFSIMIGGVVAVISRNGGMAGVVMKLEPLAKGPQSTQFVIWLLGVAIFFDDYANSLIVGNTMRPLTDKYRISREKLAYIVDSTAAPISAIAFITTWIGAELGYIGDAIPNLSGMEGAPSAYSIFLSSLKYSFYSIFTLIFILLLIYFRRDYGPMYKAEKRARCTGKVFETEGEAISDEDMEELEPVEGAPLRWINGFIPILTIILGTLMGLLETGIQSCFNQIIEAGIVLENNSWSTVWSHLAELDGEGSISALRKLGLIIGNADSYNALLWSSMLAIIVAIIMTVSQKIMSLSDSIETVIKGFKTMMPALLILIMAWSLAATTEELCTAEFLTNLLGDSLSPYMVPPVVFILAALIAFSTGSSWSTMAILYPIAIPLSWTISNHAGIETSIAMELLFNTIAVVLSASVLGDHCSPISDTTILSSMASNCNHIDHVKTQMPYALTVGAISLLLTYFSTAYSLPFLINLILGVLMMMMVVFLFGKKMDEVAKKA